MKEKYCVRIIENSDTNLPVNVFTEYLIEATNLIEILNWTYVDRVLLMEGTEHIFYVNKIRGKLVWITVQGEVK